MPFLRKSVAPFQRTTPQPKAVFVVDDHTGFRKQLINLLNGIRGIEVCGESANAEDALTGLAKTHADLVLIDLFLPGMNGFELVTRIRKRFPKLACIMVSGHPLQCYIKQAGSLGFQGYVIKGEIDQLETTVRAVLAGQSLFPTGTD